MMYLITLLKICNDGVRMDSYSLQFVPDWFVTPGQLKIWHNEVIITMMMNLSSGTMAIKNEKPKKQKQEKNFYLLPGIPMKCWIVACQKMKRGCAF